MSTLVENLMISIERISEYISLPSEHDKSNKVAAPKDWPSSGHIKFNQVSLTYDENLPDVLRSISLDINSTENIGIVGLTGAGKSTFFETLFRMYQPEGMIQIDGVDISTQPLQ